jgi:Zn-dependent peptidase ImmA (M78 family)
MREVAQEERELLGLGPTDKFDPYELAEAHGIPVYPISELKQWDLSPEAHDHFFGQNSGTWSAALIPIGRCRVIVEHDGHAEVRRRASISHEMGHHLLEHPFDAALLGENHERMFDQMKEKQATFMAGELLVPAAAARKAAYAKWDNAQVAHSYGVSAQFAQMQMSGARVIARRAIEKHGRP